MHHRFLWIHPFLDGNGRLGRLLITLILCEAGVLREEISADGGLKLVRTWSVDPETRQLVVETRLEGGRDGGRSSAPIGARSHLWRWICANATGLRRAISH